MSRHQKATEAGNCDCYLDTLRGRLTSTEAMAASKGKTPNEGRMTADVGVGTDVRDVGLKSGKLDTEKTRRRQRG